MVVVAEERVARHCEAREGARRGLELLAAADVRDVALDDGGVDAGALMSAIASSFMKRQYGTSVSLSRTTSTPGAPSSRRSSSSVPPKRGSPKCRSFSVAKRRPAPRAAPAAW